MSIDITKTYTTRSGREVRIYAVDGGGSQPVHGAEKTDDEGWDANCWCLNGDFMTNQTTDSGRDLIPAKAWRAWKYEEGPRRLMINWKNCAADTCDIAVRSQLYSDAYLFDNAQWFHEDGTTTPCGVFE